MTEEDEPPPPPPPPPRLEPATMERFFLGKLQEINSKIDQLSREKQVVSKMLLDIRKQNLRREVSRSNSVDRIMIENKIIEYLQERNTYANWKDIYKFTISTMITLNESSFRTHLHRLKLRGIITHSLKHKGWKIEKD